MTPERIQRRRKKGWRLPANTICVTRPGPWGNPFTVKECMARGLTSDAHQAHRLVVMAFAEYLRYGDVPFYEPLLPDQRRSLNWMRDNLHTLRGTNLACWCSIEQPCHADVLLELANQ